MPSGGEEDDDAFEPMEDEDEDEDEDDVVAECDISSINLV